MTRTYLARERDIYEHKMTMYRTPWQAVAKSKTQPEEEEVEEPVLPTPTALEYVTTHSVLIPIPALQRFPGRRRLKYKWSGTKH